MAVRAATASTHVHQATKRAGATSAISISLHRRLLAQTDAVTRRTQWGKSRVIANALEIYTALPSRVQTQIAQVRAEADQTIDITQRLADALTREINQIEWEHQSRERAAALAGRLPVDITEAQILRHAKRAIAASRTERRRGAPNGDASQTRPGRGRR